jgi:putative hydrolase of the HAD superfamily
MTGRTTPVRAVLFDLDDTLYPEWTFFRSGFRVVALELIRRGLSGDPDTLADRMLELHGVERPGVLERFSAELPFPAAWVPELIEIFRGHDPQIALPEATAGVLARLRKRFRLGCVSDGWLNVQKRKLAALGLESALDAVVLTDAWGRTYWKPHPAPFLRCCEALGVPPGAAVFVGDHPARDIQGAQRAGLTAILLTEHGKFHLQAIQDSRTWRFDSLETLANALLEPGAL